MTRETRSTCPYCGVGCGVIIESTGDEITGVRGDPEHPANFGRLCTKGSTLHLTASATVTRQTRLLQPMQRLARGEAPAAVAWDTALDNAAGKFAQVIRDHGPDSVGFYVSGQLLTEDYYVFNKLAKGLIGTNNIDTNSRLCMSSAVAGYKQTLGADAPPACYDDLKDAQCLFIVGSNTAWAHPILFRRIEDAKAANPALKIVVADPRRTDTVEIADLFLPIQPGTDVMLFNGMLHLMLWEGWIDAKYIASHTNGFDALKATVRECTPEKVAQVCGIPKEDLLEAARLFATSPATLSLYCQGLNQSSSGTAKNAALINLHLATAQIGKPGAGPFSLTGQPNAMGGREVGGLANLLSAHRDLANPDHRAEVAALWGVPTVPEKPGKTAVEMFQAAADGEIRALWIACTNPAQSMPDQATVRRALERAEFVVVQEAFSTTATCAFADLLLPATTWGEKEGTVTNSERRISRVRPAVPAPGDARNDWSIAVAFAHRLERQLGRTFTLFPYETAESVWNEHRESTRGRDLDITGMSYAMLETAGPQQWPLKEGESTGRVRLYEDGVFPTPDGRARFVDTAYKPVAEAREARYPFSLNTGRLRDQWHGMSRTGTAGRLFGHVPEPVVQMNAQDMARRQIGEGDLVHLTSKRGSIMLPARASAEVGLSQAFVAMHWGEEYLSGCSSNGTRLAGINALTTPAFCPTSKQPELKHTPVKVLKAELPWSLLAMAWLPAAEALAAHRALQPMMALFPFATCVPFSGNTQGTERTGILFRAAAHDAPDDALVEKIETLLGLQAADALRYADRRRGQRRTARLVRRADGSAGLEAFLLGGDTSAEAWIATLLREELPAQSYGRLLLSPGSKAPVAVQSRGKTVCTCFNVADVAIQTELARCTGNADERLAKLQGALKCGTNCGSCIPELKRMVRATPAEALAEAP
ncbi:nitrate reductase [Variovorax sp. NFACC27]|uniref:nitrate reductase n=1 Tax=unclassified Variovorax TaxID=663243 RepID=UPI00089889B3|nr:assimilatory nitrate reductase (NADH) alpha subunit apoprotein [Variovorax sp. NFACC28]SEG23606.1 assimilatory nitrate reductase (NADH) alpha subunit apoprotein [Variovorax sp. NFACC29]SFC48170.1 assimilatory nitrate reductase (NADH) alpha subunit apoprotein [Variovorax sp. NFACC26]SFF92954.1 assimilatory nitrate reductase (NADH) alpha subunit apoprotein [Variovorax sp. NFACC27]